MCVCVCIYIYAPMADRHHDVESASFVTPPPHTPRNPPHPNTVYGKNNVFFESARKLFAPILCIRCLNNCEKVQIIKQLSIT